MAQYEVKVKTATVQGNPKIIQDIQNELKFFDNIIVNDDKNADAYHMKGIYLIKLAQQTKDHSYLDKALECYNIAIKLTDSKEALYLVDRSRLYVDMGKTDLALEDIKIVNKLPKSVGITEKYIGNAINNIARLEVVQVSVTNLLAAGKIDNELARVLQAHANVTAELVVQVGAYGEKLDKHDDNIHELNHMIEEMHSVVVDLQQGKTDSAQQIATIKADLQKETERLKKQVISNLEQIEKHEVALVDSGAYSKALVKQGFDKLKAEENKELYAYCQVFYWTTVNLFNAHRSLSTGLIQGQTKQMSDDMLEQAISAAAGMGIEVAKGIPVVGVLMRIVEKVANTIMDKRKERKFNDKVNKINKIIQAKFTTEDDISINIAQLALAITEVRREVILQGKVSPTSQGSNIVAKLSRAVKNIVEKFKEKLRTVTNAILPTMEELHDPSSFGTQLALKDVVLLTVYLLTNCETVLGKDEPLESLSEQFKVIVGTGTLDLK